MRAWSPTTHQHLHAEPAERRAGRNVERAAWAAALAFLALIVMASMLESRVVSGLAALCLVTASVLFAAAGFVSGEQELGHGIFRRAAEPVRFWLVTVSMAILGGLYGRCRAHYGRHRHGDFMAMMILRRHARRLGEAWRTARR